MAPFDPEKTDYSSKDLEAYAETLLREDMTSRKLRPKDTGILFDDHIASRKQREVYNKWGVPLVDGAIQQTETGRYKGDGQTLYWRTHPQGRKVNSKDQRSRNGAGWYR